MLRTIESLEEGDRVLMKMDRIRATPCPSSDGKHVFTEAAPPWYVVCNICGQRFALISEDVMNLSGLELRERDIEIVVRH